MQSEEPAGLGFAGQSGEPRILSKDTSHSTALQHSSHLHPLGSRLPAAFPLHHMFSLSFPGTKVKWEVVLKGGEVGAARDQAHGRIRLGCRARAVSLESKRSRRGFVPRSAP